MTHIKNYFVLLLVGNFFVQPIVVSMEKREAISFKEKASKFASKALITLDLSKDAALLATGTMLFAMYHLTKGSVYAYKADSSLLNIFSKLELESFRMSKRMTYPRLCGVGGNSICLGSLSLMLAILVGKLSGNNPMTIDAPVEKSTTEAQEVIRKLVAYLFKGGSILALGGMAVVGLEFLDVHCTLNNISLMGGLKDAFASWMRACANNLVPAASIATVGLAIAYVTGHKPLESLKNMKKLSAQVIANPSECAEYIKSRVIDSPILTGIIAAITGISPDNIRESVSNQYNAELYWAWCDSIYWSENKV